MEKGEISFDELKQYLETEIFVYQQFQVIPTTIVSILSGGLKNPPLFKIREKGVEKDSFFLYPQFFKTFETAKEKQALDVFKILIGTYRSDNTSLMGMAEYYERFVDEYDIEFFILETTRYQMTATEYTMIMRKISMENPERLL